MKHLLYFGYGSNMNPDVMKKRIGDWHSVSRAVLYDYKFVFMPRPGIVIPVIVPSKGDKVLGAVFRITEDQLKEIDKYESPYSTETVEVETLNGKVEALAYVFNLEYFLMRVEDYRSSWIEGLRQHEFGEEEIAEVRKIMDRSITAVKELA
ncbi:MAG: gamma-glutamylcyclotransferase family protein [Planctomycetota bacterium]|jgi:gamma-glutamylcyclotransferase (GGCT)/AIG2-like uncharacterized protein YtfP